MNEATRKILRMEVIVTFEGDYYGADEVTGVVQGWVEGALDDRDDLMEVDFGRATVLEESLDE